jgi:hypothetical protein
MHPYRFGKVVYPILIWLFTSVLCPAHHLPPGMEEIDEFAHQALPSALTHPPAGHDHWGTAFIVMGLLVAFRLMFAGPFRQRKALAC